VTVSGQALVGLEAQLAGATVSQMILQSVRLCSARSAHASASPFAIRASRTSRLLRDVLRLVIKRMRIVVDEIAAIKRTESKAT